MKKEYILVGIVIVLAVLSFVVPNVLRNKYRDKFAKLFAAGKSDEIKKLLDKPLVKYIFMPFNVEYLRLNVAFLEDDEEGINKQFDLLFNMPANEKQKEDLYFKALNYYVAIEDNERSKKAHDLAMKLKDEKVKKSADVTYNVFVEKGYKYLDEIESNFEKCPEELKGFNAYLISLMYENKKDEKNAQKYAEIASQYKRRLQEETKDAQK